MRFLGSQGGFMYKISGKIGKKIMYLHIKISILNKNNLSINKKNVNLILKKTSILNQKNNI
jgi:hypothetical protein